MVPDVWIADGCREAARLRFAGYSAEAAEVLRVVERRALGCAHCGEATPLGRVEWCSDRCQRSGNDRRSYLRRKDKPCSVVGCERVRRSRTLCIPHFRMLREGRLTREVAA